MPPRPTHHPGLGAYLAGFKKTKDRSGWRAEAALAARAGKRRLNYSQFVRLTSGKNKSIDPEVLREFAEFYGVSYEDLIAGVVKFLFGVSLARAEGGTDPARQAELERELAAERERSRELQAHLDRLMGAVEHIRSARGDPAKGSRTA